MAKIGPPIRGFSLKTSISQMFGVNAAYYQPNHGIPGHNALDIIKSDDKRGYGAPIIAAHDGVVTQATQDVPWRTKGNGIVIAAKDGAFATIYWHLAGFECAVGEEVKRGQVIGLMGNTGEVFPQPTKLCPHCGTHLHFGVLEYGHENAYKGFVDPAPYMIDEGDKLPIQFNRSLFLGSSGDDVSWLQTVLRCEGFAEDYDPVGFFGTKTLRDVIAFQKKYGISPAIGYVGPLTRVFLNKKWSVWS